MHDMGLISISVTASVKQSVLYFVASICIFVQFSEGSSTEQQYVLLLQCNFDCSHHSSFGCWDYHENKLQRSYLSDVQVLRNG
jgi:hypothetical protein